MDIMTAHALLTMLELLAVGWEVYDYRIMSDDRIMVEVFNRRQGRAKSSKTIYFERGTNNAK